MAGGASETFAAEHTVHTALASEQTISNASWSVWHIEGTVAGADSKPGQLVGVIGLAAQKAGRLTFPGIKELERGIVGNGRVSYILKFKGKDGIIYCIAINCFHLVIPPFRSSGDSIDAVEWCHHLICIAVRYHN
jgi:hypothetical protein